MDACDVMRMNKQPRNGRRGRRVRTEGNANAQSPAYCSRAKAGVPHMLRLKTEGLFSSQKFSQKYHIEQEFYM